jgi:SAM-dependent methyltransferase
MAAFRVAIMKNFCFCFYLVFTSLFPLLHAGDAPPSVTDGPKSRDGIGKFFMGREIAHVMGHQAAAWLERPEREQEEEPTKLLQALELKSTDIVADIGCGTGFHCFRMAPSVASVLGVDIQQEMLDLMMGKAKELNLANVKPILGTITDPKLPVGGVDLILMVDVYHEFDHPVEMLTAIRTSLSPTGRVALVEFRGEDPKVPIKDLHKMSEFQARREFESLGFTWDRTVSTLPWQHLIFFKR